VPNFFVMCCLLMSSSINVDRQTLRELIKLAYPMVVSQGAFALMIFTDRYFMSLISPTHMAASLGGGVAAYFCMSLFIGILSYGNALVAQYFGAGETAKCPRVVTQGLLLCLAFIPVLLAIGYAVGALFGWIGHEPGQVLLERQYFYILLWGSGLSLAKTCLASYFAGIGRTRVVMIADTVGVALNIPLSYLLIFGVWGLPELGIAGAAWGTIISTLFSLGLFLAFYLAPHHRRAFAVARSLVIDRGILRRYVRLGLPSGMEMFLNVAAFNLFLMMFQSYGVVEAASAAIVFNWDMLSFIPMIGLNVALISLVGRFVGERDMTRLRGVVVAGFVIGLLYSSLLAVMFVLFSGPLVALFVADPLLQLGHSTEPSIVALASFMMVGLATYVMADATVLIAGGILRGAGDTRWLMWASVAAHWVMLVMQYLVIKVFELGPRVSWVTFVLMVLSIAGLYLWRLKGPTWRTPEAFQRVMDEH
jgi:multidrug resistance protein, MATE family